MKRYLALFSAIAVGLFLCAGYGELFIDGPLRHTNSAAKLCALWAALLLVGYIAWYGSEEKR